MSINKKVMLIADDMEMNRAVLYELFQDSYAIMEASDGREALNLLIKYQAVIDIVLLDLAMPVMDGLELLGELSRRKMVNRFPIVLIASENSEQAVVRGLRLGAADIISGPFRSSIVRNRIENMLELWAGRGGNLQQDGVECPSEVRRAEFLEEWEDLSSGSRQQRAMWLLEMEQKKYKILMELSGDIMFTFDLNNDRIELSERCGEVFGCPMKIDNIAEYALTHKLVHEDDSRRLKAFKMSIDGTVVDKCIQIRLRLKNGSYEWFEANLRCLPSFEGGRERQIYIGKLTNVHQINQERERLKLESGTDCLTGLSNLKSARERIEKFQTASHAGSGAMIFIDIDDLKQINDKFGRLTGDEVLIETANLLRSNFRKTDILARLEGGKFIVFMKSYGQRSSLELKLNQLLMEFRKMRLEGIPSLSVHASIGAVRYPEHSTDFETLFSYADRAVYTSKTKGKNRYTIHGEQERSKHRPKKAGEGELA